MNRHFTSPLTPSLAFLCVALMGLGLFGCDTRRTVTDSGSPMVDSGPPATDAGPPATDAGPPATDAGLSDPCAATQAEAVSTVGCNGGVYGSALPDDQLDGACTPDGADPPGAGSCGAAGEGSAPLCLPDEADPSAGTCVYLCPFSSDYVTTGGCPSGSRCFSFRAEMDFGICFRDCNSGADCATGETCDAEGSCVIPM